MPRIRRCAAVVCLLFALGAVSALAGFGDDGLPGRQIRKEARRSFIQRILDYLDNKLSTPPG